MTPPFRIPASALVLAAVLAATAPAAAQQVVALTDLSLEQLSEIEVTSVGKRVQRLTDVAGSVHVIHPEDIRRSGALTLPEVLRLAPNLHVARAEASRYAITARGFASLLANKLLVQVDGRTVYSPLFSGVFWDTQDLLLDDIDRIEVLSGAGGTLYGSNAVNGVINIVTRSAAETTGGVAKLALGPEERVAAARWGAATDAGTYWRIWAKRYLAERSELATGGAAYDDVERSAAGFRADRTRGTDHLMVQGQLLAGTMEQAPAARDVAGAHLLARWTRDDPAGVRTQLQAYFDRAQRREPGRVRDTLDTWDIELQQQLRPGPDQELLWGAGYRRHQDDLQNLAPALLRLVPAQRDLQLWNVFAQNEWKLTPRLKATAGLKAEHNSYTGLEWLPNLRLAWTPTPGHLLWAGASRAVRKPARVDREAFTPLLNLGGRDFQSEVANVFELGWRGQSGPALSWSATVFHHQFSRLRSIDVRPGGLAFGNSHEGQLNGVEVWGRWRATDRLRLQAGYTHQRLSLATRAGSTVTPTSEAQLANDPRDRTTLGIAWDIAPRLELDLHLRRVGALPQPAVAAYTAADARLGWRPHPNLELSLAVRNLAGGAHAEWPQPGAQTAYGRSIHVKAVWRQ